MLINPTDRHLPHLTSTRDMVNIYHIIDQHKRSTTGGSMSENELRSANPGGISASGKTCSANSFQNIPFRDSDEEKNFIWTANQTAGRVPFWKRFLDCLCIILSMPFWLPLMLGIAVWIRCATRGPVIFRQTRIGRNEEPFMLFKFRTMEVDAQHHAHHRYFRTIVKGGLPMTKMDSYDDKRLIPGGRFLRVTGLDELPQLLNVLQGKMSLVGPRPCLPEELRWYDDSQRARFKCLPGITGYWQVNGKNSTTFEKMIELDTHYAERVSFFMDAAIILVTIPALILHAMESRRERSRLRDHPLPLRADTVRIE